MSECLDSDYKQKSYQNLHQDQFAVYFLDPLSDKHKIRIT